MKADRIRHRDSGGSQCALPALRAVGPNTPVLETLFRTTVELLISLFEEKVRPIDEQMRTLFIENHKLRAARDLLLPRLMSGEITV